MPKVKLPRTQGRWSYKTTPKPRIVIRKQVEVEEESRASSAENPSTMESPVTMLDDSRATAAATLGTASAAAGGVANAQRKELSLSEDELDPSESEDVASVSVQDQQLAGEQILPIETLNVEISTVADQDSVYFEIATIKSPYSFQVIFYIKFFKYNYSSITIFFYILKLYLERTNNSS